jgi:hypothetical protein
MTSLFSFSPVPSKSRRADGWTAKKQVAFIEALADSGMVSVAAMRAGMSRASAYVLRARPGAESFSRAWDAALDVGFEKMQDFAIDRALNGECVPYFYQGEMIGERRRYDNRLLIFMMQQNLNRRYGEIAVAIRAAEAETIKEQARKIAQERETAQALSRSVQAAKQLLIDKLNMMRQRMNGKPEGSPEEQQQPTQEEPAEPPMFVLSNNTDQNGT